MEEVAQDTAADAAAESALRMYSKYSIIRHGERVSDEVSQRDGQTKEKEHCDKRRFSGVWKYVCIFGIWSGVRGIYLELNLGRPCVSHDGLGGASEAF